MPQRKLLNEELMDEVPTIQRPKIRVVIDSETTGLGPNDPNGARPDGVVQTGWAWKELGSVHTSVLDSNPGEEFFLNGRAEGALKVNKFTMQRIHDAVGAERAAKLLREFLDGIATRGQGEVVLYAYNCSFDRWFYTQVPWSLPYKWGDDLMARAIKVLHMPAADRLPLAKALALAGIPNERAHDAEGDAKAEYALMEWLDIHEQEAEREYDLDAMAKDITDFVTKHAASEYSYKRKQDTLSGTVSPTDLYSCPLELWRKARGVYVKDWGAWRSTRGAWGDAAEPIPLTQMANAGLKVIRGRSLPPVYEASTKLYGHLDAMVEWPRASDIMHVADVKSTNEPLSMALRGQIWERYALQLGAYMRMTGEDHAFFIFYSLDKRDLGKWALRPIKNTPELQANIVDRVDTILRLRKPDAPEPQCTCGRCDNGNGEGP